MSQHYWLFLCIILSIIFCQLFIFLKNVFVYLCMFMMLLNTFEHLFWLFQTINTETVHKEFENEEEIIVCQRCKDKVCYWIRLKLISLSIRIISYDIRLKRGASGKFMWEGKLFELIDRKTFVWGEIHSICSKNYWIICRKIYSLYFICLPCFSDR